KGYDAYFYHVQNKSKRYFRIRVGHYKSRAEAEAAMAGMKKTGWRDMFISRLED
ncbi:MAG: SPOR domain-containing protein, partial [Deltaproteobacteria bacterium]|nr:SPOR domain-containing protein [Deltaproteobacteria bacterium]